MYRNPKNGRAVKSSGNMLKYVEFPEKKSLSAGWIHRPSGGAVGGSVMGNSAVAVKARFYGRALLVYIFV